MKKAQLLYDYDSLELGPTPAMEDCAQVGWDNYVELSKMELKAYKNQLTRMFPNMPEGAYFKINRNPHDFGTYYELAIKYPVDDKEASDFAYMVENNLPENWDEQAKAELNQSGYFQMMEQAKQKGLVGKTSTFNLKNYLKKN